LLPDAQLAMSELVTNAVIHARTPLIASVSCAAGAFEMAVFDGNPALPPVRSAGPDTAIENDDPIVQAGGAGVPTGGRGLLLVAALAAEWGVSPGTDGKAVWVRKPTPEGWPHAVGCPCSTSEQADTLASGRRVVHRS
jgi:anti-sigma regulatory factor (Ser/Thr protein kinase)